MCCEGIFLFLQNFELNSKCQRQKKLLKNIFTKEIKFKFFKFKMCKIIQHSAQTHWCKRKKKILFLLSIYQRRKSGYQGKLCFFTFNHYEWNHFNKCIATWWEIVEVWKIDIIECFRFEQLWFPHPHLINLYLNDNVKRNWK